MNRREKIMLGAAHYVAYARKNPHVFAEQYLRLRLKLFQKILLIMMNCCNTVVFLGARGIGKTYLTAVFCAVRCILYPGRSWPVSTVMCDREPIELLGSPESRMATA